MDFAKRIDELRNERKWTQYRLSMKSGIPLPTIQAFSENHDITLSSIERLCNAFEISLPEFFMDESIEIMAVTPEQKQLYQQWSALMPVDQAAINQLMKTIIESQK